MNFKQYFSIILEQAKIVAPAVKDLQTNRVIKGNFGELHMNIYDRIVAKLATLKKMNRDRAADIFNKKFGKRFESGFIDNEGKFYNREEAFELSKQKIMSRDPERTYKKLASEDLPDLKD
jgi:hypothetical protein